MGPGERVRQCRLAGLRFDGLPDVLDPGGDPSAVRRGRVVGAHRVVAGQWACGRLASPPRDPACDSNGHRLPHPAAAIDPITRAGGPRRRADRARDAAAGRRTGRRGRGRSRTDARTPSLGRLRDGGGCAFDRSRILDLGDLGRFRPMGPHRSHRPHPRAGGCGPDPSDGSSGRRDLERPPPGVHRVRGGGGDADVALATDASPYLVPALSCGS